MRVLKWQYDKQFKIWWTGESTAWAYDGYTIKKENTNYYTLTRDSSSRWIGTFKKLSSAKKVADLLENG